MGGALHVKALIPAGGQGQTLRDLRQAVLLPAALAGAAGRFVARAVTAAGGLG